MSSCDKKVLTPSEKNKLTAECSVISVLYALLILSPVLHNIYRYLIRQKRYQVFLTSLFYILALIVGFTGIMNQVAFAVHD